MMKTLYININGEKIDSTEDVFVVGRVEDAIINRFYFELGKEVLKGVVSPGISSIKKKDIILDFKVHDESAFNTMMQQWEVFKCQLLGDNPVGEFAVKLPTEYISWLKDSSLPVYAESAKSLYRRGGVVSIGIDKLYTNISNLIVNNIDNGDFASVVVNDNLVTDDSALVMAIQKKFPNITFKPFEEWGGNEAKEMEPCEILSFKNEQKTNFKYLIYRGSGEFEILNQDGSRIEELGTVKMVDNLFNKTHRFYDDEESLPYVLCMNSTDKKLYFVSARQIYDLGDWSDGRICNDTFNSYGKKNVTVINNFRGFYITDRYDYVTYYKVVDGICEETTKEIYSEIEKGLPYYIDTDDDDMPLCISIKTGNPITIPGFKVCIYLGHNGNEEIFWATRKYTPEQYRFKESFIVNVRGEIIRNYEYHYALPLTGKYILNIKDGIGKAITDLDSNLIIRCNLKYYPFDEGIDEYSQSELYDNVKCIDGEVYKFEELDDEEDNKYKYWLMRDNVICDDYNKYFYFQDIKDDLYTRIYRRSDKSLVKTCSLIRELADDVLLIEYMDKGCYKKAYLDKEGYEIYRLSDNSNESPCIKTVRKRHGLGMEDFTEECGVSENRIIINVDNRYYKIIDYSAKEIVRIDYNVISECYHNGKLFYITDTEFGYYDVMGKKNVLPYSFKNKYGSTWWIKTLSDKLLLIGYYNYSLIVDVEGNVLLEGRRIVYDSCEGKFIKVTDKNLNVTVYDFNCKKITSLASEEEVFIIK